MAADQDWAGIQVRTLIPTEVALSVELFATGWQTQLERELTVSSDSWALDFADVPTIPIRIPSQLPKTMGVLFPEAKQLTPEPWLNLQATTASKSSVAYPSLTQASLNQPSLNQASNSAQRSQRRSRIRPPADVVKLEDRLYFLLQPPLENLAASARLSFPFPPFPYQFEGVAFLFPRESAILADEMGLGKTMQAITAIRMLLLAQQIRSVLLICPKPLVTNWVREFQLWAPEIPVTVMEGDTSKRQFAWRQPRVPIRIANYELLMRDRAILQDPQVGFDLVILDEAQRIKNRHSTTAEIARSLTRGRSWALTGTPIENAVDDLVNIFEFIAPGHLRSEMNLRTICKASRDYILRRTKEQVLTEMPPKMFRDERLELTPAQYVSYRAAEDEGVVQLEELGETLTIQHVFELVLRLKQICNFDPATGASCKLEQLEADMEEIAASGHKAIVFSQWVGTLERLAEIMQRFGPLQYHGRIPSRERERVLEQFKQDHSKHLILMSYGAGSVGLNLQFCQYVFLFDRWWNPAVEDQAVNRAHRIGAAGPVTVTRMMTADTIEQRIHDVLEQKRELFHQLFAEAGSPRPCGLSQDEIFGLFQLSVPKASRRKDRDQAA